MKKTNTLITNLKVVAFAAAGSLLSMNVMAQNSTNMILNHPFNCGGLSNTAVHSTANTASDRALGRLVPSFSEPNRVFVETTTDRGGVANAAVGIGGTRLLNNLKVTQSGELFDHTLSFWIKVDTANIFTNALDIIKFMAPGVGFGELGYRVALSKDFNTNDINLQIYNANFGNGSHRGGFSSRFNVNSLSDQDWHHIVVTSERRLSGGGIKHTVTLDNNVSNKFTYERGNPGGLWYYLRNAQFQVNPTRTFNNCFIDDIIIYDYVLTNPEIDTMYRFNESRAPKTFYVNEAATGNNDGSSWANAFTNPRQAMIDAKCNDEIWVAKGTYSHPTGDRNRIFGWTADSLSLLGGFDGTEDQAFKRDPKKNETIFSGEVQNDNDQTNNSLTVLAGPLGTFRNVINYSLIDGITVQDGYARTGGFDAGIAGAGIFMFDYVRQLDINNCVIRNNWARNAGGGLYVKSYFVNKTVNVSNCIFTGNAARSGSAIQAQGDNNLNVQINLSNSLIYDNDIFSESGLDGVGGTVQINSRNSGTAGASVYNNTITKNTKSATNTFDNVALLTTGVSIEAFNNIIWNNEADFSIRDQTSSALTVTIENNLLEHTSNLVSGTIAGNINSDPLFTDTANNNFSLLSGSPAIDAGKSYNMMSAKDLKGAQRVFGSSVDIGAYEFGGQIKSVKNAKNTISINLYPNPAKESIQIATEIENGKYEIYTMQGQLVANGTAENSIDIAQLNAGTFIIRVFNETVSGSQKLIKL